MNPYTIRQLMKDIAEAQKVSGEKDAYELELEMGDMTFRLDIKDLDKLLIKLQTISKALEGAN